MTWFAPRANKVEPFSQWINWKQMLRFERVQVGFPADISDYLY